MNPTFESLETKAQELVAGIAAGRISEQEFAAQAQALRTCDDKGIWWQLSPANGAWLCWNGTRWEPSNPPKTAPAPQPATAPASLPNPLAQGLVAQLGTTMLRQFLFRLPIVLLTLFSTWAAHTYFLVVSNEGFNPSTTIGQWLNVSGNYSSALAIWGMVSALFWSAVVSVFRCGPLRTFTALFSTPLQTVRMVVRSVKNRPAGCLLAIGATLWLGSFYRLNWQSCAAISAAWLFLGTGYPGILLRSLLAAIFSRMSSPTQSLLARAKEELESFSATLVPAFALSAFLVSAGEPWRSRLAALCLLGGIAWIFFGNKKPPSTPISAPPPLPSLNAFLAWAIPSSIWLGIAWFLGSSRAYADDGGWVEATQSSDLNWANFIKWWNSAGSGQAIANGLSPSAAAAAAAGLTPPLASPTDGLQILDDATKGQTVDGQTYEYSVAVQSTGGSLIPADGRTPQQFYAIASTNDPKWTVAKMSATVQFSFTAPTGFALQAQNTFTSGGTYRHVDVICTASSESAFAPGKIPGVVYATASSPLGSVRGHAQVQIEVGGGNLVIPPPERNWLRAPSKGRNNTPPPLDIIYLYVRIEWPDYCRFTSADSPTLNSSITCRPIGQNAALLAVATPTDTPDYRCYAIQPAVEPGVMTATTAVQLGIEGKIMGGLLQKVHELQLFPAPSLTCKPEAPFLIPGSLETTKLEFSILGIMPKEEWTLHLEHRTGSLEIVPEPTISTKQPGTFQAKATLGSLPDTIDKAEVSFAFYASEKSGLETEELVVTFLVTRPGLIVLSKLPVPIPADAKTAVAVEMTVIRYLPGTDGKPGSIAVDEAALAPKALVFSPTVEAEGAALRAFRSAALQISYSKIKGSGLNKCAVYLVQGTAIIPGDGTPHLGKIEVQAPIKKDEVQSNFSRKLELSLPTIQTSTQVKDYVTEKKLFIEALSEMILVPYSTIQTMRSKQSQLEWAQEWWLSFIEETPDDQLEKLQQVYQKYRDLLDKDTHRDPQYLFDRRRDFYRDTTTAWAAIADQYRNYGAFLSACEKTADWAKWLSEAIFPKIVEILYVRAGDTPEMADLKGSMAGYLQKYVNEFVGQFAEASDWDTGKYNPWEDALVKTLEKMREMLVPDIIDIVWGQGEKWFEAKGEIPGLEGPAAAARAIKIKAVIYSYFFTYKFFVHWIYDKNEKNENLSAADAASAAAWDVAGKTLADVFEWAVQDSHKSASIKDQLGKKYDELKSFIDYMSGGSGGSHGGSAGSSSGGGGDAPSPAPAPTPNSGTPDAPAPAPAPNSGTPDAPAPVDSPNPDQMPPRSENASKGYSPE